ncbi:MAG: hypothetical protein QXK88_07105 [Desulfurococcaceae archaeon]
MLQEESLHEEKELGKVLAVLYVELGDPSYIDKLAQSSSKDLVLFRIGEALRDYHSLVNKGFENESVAELARSIDFQRVEKCLSKIKAIDSVKELRETISLATSYALAEAARLRSREAYLTAKSVLTYLSQKGLLKDHKSAQDIRKIVEENIDQVSRELIIPKERILDVLKDEKLIERLLSKMEVKE